MTITSLVLLAVAGLAAVANWVSRATDDQRLEHLTKPTATVLLLAVALTVEAREPAQQAWFAVAIILSLAGDIFLMLRSERFAAGLGSFLLAHVAFVGGFAAAGIDPVPFLLGAAGVAVLTLPVGGRIVRALRASGQGALVAPIVVYMTAIGVLVAGAAGVRSGLAIAGALAFLASDSLLAWNRFVRPLPWARVGVMVTYHLAQAGLVLSLAV